MVVSVWLKNRILQHPGKIHSAIIEEPKFIDNKNQGRGEGPIFEDGGMFFFVAERESKVSAMLKKIPGTRFVSSKELDNDNVVILLNPSYLKVVGGFPLSDFFLSEWLKKPPLTQIDYNCGVRPDPRSNPYFKKQN